MGPVDRNIAGADFAERVVSRSALVPVVVDFWAAWCQPCRILSPTLERLERASEGAWELVKVDIDREPALANQFQITSIPALKGFRDGRVVAEMLGAQPESAIRSFLAGLLPSEADRLVAEAADVLRTGSYEQAENILRRALAVAPEHGPGLLALGSLLSEHGRLDEAAEVLERIPAMTNEGRRARATLARVSFMRAATADAGIHVDTGVAASDDAHWAAGNRLAAAGNYREALTHFLWLVEHNRRYRDDEGRRAALSVFDILGPDDPITMEFRPRLSSLLF